MPDNRETLSAFINAVNVQDIPRLLDVFSPDAVMVTPQAVVEGRDELEWYFQQLFTAFPNVHDIPKAQVAYDDTALLEWIFTATHAGPLVLPGGIEAQDTGREVTLPVCAVLAMEQGLIVSARLYYDQVTMYGQLGYRLTV